MPQFTKITIVLEDLDTDSLEEIFAKIQNGSIKGYDRTGDGAYCFDVTNDVPDEDKPFGAEAEPTADKQPVGADDDIPF